MDAPHYVHDDVYSGLTFYKMFCYTNHKDMDALQYVHDDVPSDIPVS